MSNVPLTELLNRWIAGDARIAEEVFETLYPELKVIAHAQLARARGGEIQTTELVHEAYIRLQKQRAVEWKSREHLFGIASLLMRRLLVDSIRAQGAERRGAGAVRIELDEESLVARTTGEEALDLDAALEKLELEAPRPAAVVTMRYFGGMTMEEIATALEISVSTVESDWRFARAWLRRSLAKRDGSGA